ncbi:MAG: GDSL-type esterase/lipase family protein [Lachnospiraceae bacterium]
MVPEKKIKVVCMGDSITEGFGLDDITCTYPFLLQEFLGEDYEVFNQGVTSSCVSNKELNGRVCGLPYVRQDRYREALALQGDIYVIMLGTNDAQDGMDDVLDVQDPYNNLISLEPEFETYYQAIIDAVFVAAPGALIFIVTPMPVGFCIWRKHQERYLLRLLPHIEAVAAANALPLVDLHSEFLKLPEAELTALYQDDGLHPNVSGTMLIASILAYAIGNRSY